MEGSSFVVWGYVLSETNASSPSEQSREALYPGKSPFPCQSRASLTIFTASQTGTKPRQNPDSISQATFVALPTDSDGFQLQLGSQTRADRLANTVAYTDTTGEEKRALAGTVPRPDSSNRQRTRKATPEAMQETSTSSQISTVLPNAFTTTSINIKHQAQRKLDLKRHKQSESSDPRHSKSTHMNQSPTSNMIGKSTSNVQPLLYGTFLKWERMNIISPRRVWIELPLLSSHLMPYTQKLPP